MEYLSTKWQKLRQRALRRDGYKCQLCARYGRQKEGTTVHHAFPAEHYPELQYNINNCVTLCTQCHEKCHYRASHELTEEGKKLQQRIGQKYGFDINNR